MSDHNKPDEFCAGGRPRRKKGGMASGMMARPRLDQRARKLPAGALTPPAEPAILGSAATPVGIGSVPRGTSPNADAELKAGGRANWIQGMGMRKGALHQQLGIPAGDKIPATKLQKAAHSDDPTLRRRATLAQTLKGFH